MDDEVEPLDQRQYRRRRADQPAPAKTFGYAVAVVSLVGCVFSAGYNWRSVAEVEKNQENFVRKDVQAQELNRVNDRLYEISKQLEELRGELRSQRRQP